MGVLAKGDRVFVRLSNRRSFTGVIVGEGRVGQWWHILKDGTKRPQAYSKSLCRPADAQPNPIVTE